MLILLPMASVTSANENILTLTEAIARTFQHHPQINSFQLRHLALEGARRQADLRPGYDLELALEKVAGSGEFGDLKQAESSIALSSVIELGNKQDVRLELVASERDLLEFEQQIVALELLRDITHRYIDLMATQAKLKLAREDSHLAENIYRLAKRRADAGGAAEAEVKRAQAAASQARLKVLTANSQFESQKTALAALWGEANANFASVEDKLLAFGEKVPSAELFARLNESPFIQIFSAHASKKNAELHLAQSDGAADLDWELGIKQIEASNDMALIAGLSVPLYMSSRARGQIKTARAEQEHNLTQKRMAILNYRTQLFQAINERQLAIVTVASLKEEILPALTAALTETQQGYQRGRYAYQELVTIQRELLEARQNLIQVAAKALYQEALIKQLTAHNFDAARYQSNQNRTGKTP